MSKYLYDTLSEMNLGLSIYNGSVEKPQYPFISFVAYGSRPVKYVANQLAFDIFEATLSLWSKTGFEYSKANSIIRALDGVQGVEVTHDSESGIINSVVYNGQQMFKELLDNNTYYCIRTDFTIKVK